jgi:hypothetical protein
MYSSQTDSSLEPAFFPFLSLVPDSQQFNSGSYDLNDPAEMISMRHEFRQILGRSTCLLVVLGLLVAVTPGCGGDEAKQGEAAGGVPPALKKSNDNMENFMKSQSAAKKK